MLNLNAIDKTWTLFLDRDGVLYHEKNNDYIRNWEEFIFYEKTVAAITLLNNYFNRTVIVTNQKGIGKGLMSIADLNSIHQQMLTAIESAGGKIDHVYFCADVEDDSPNRKPQPGMAFQAKLDYPEIDFAKSIMVGNRMSDMHFGRNAGMHTVFVATTHPEVTFPNTQIDLRFNDLFAFATACNSLRK